MNIKLIRLSTVDLSIAEFSIRLFCNVSQPIEFELGYEPFIKTCEGEPDVCIEVIPGIPQELLGNENQIFEARNPELKFYTIHQAGDALKFIVYNQQRNSEVQQIAFLDASFSKWQIYTLVDANHALLPLRYPLGPLMMYYLTVKTEAIMIHSSGVFDGHKGRLFTGFSGAGKSTISGLWAKAGSLLINDDRLIIRKKEGRYVMYNTPMYYNDDPKEAPLDAIFLISHSPVNKIKKQNGALAVTKVLAHCIQNNYKKEYISNHLDFLSGLSTIVSISELGFVPDNSVIDFIIANES